MLRLLPRTCCLLISTGPVHSSALFFSKTSPDFFSCVGCDCVGPQNKIGHPAGCKFPCWVPAEHIQAKKKHDLWYDNVWNEWLGDRVKFVFSPDVILCGWLGSNHELTNWLLVLLSNLCLSLPQSLTPPSSNSCYNRRLRSVTLSLVVWVTSVHAVNSLCFFLSVVRQLLELFMWNVYTAL